MFLGKVGNKSIAFINHKPFHPGNLQNLEKVWLAEQKAEEEKRKQKELLERRKHEVQIEGLQQALREKERQQNRIASSPTAALFAEGGGIVGSNSSAASSGLSALHSGLYIPTGKPPTRDRGRKRAGGGGVASDFVKTTSSSSSTAPSTVTSENHGVKRRKVKSDGPEAAFVVKSRYAEDIFGQGHSSVWGSYFDRDSKRWGYACCHTMEKLSRCSKGTKEAKEASIEAVAAS